MQFLLYSYDLKAKTFELRGGEAFHVARVLRKKPGDCLRLFDGKGKRLWGEIIAIGDARVSGRIMDTPPLFTDSYDHLGKAVMVFQALPRAAKWEWVLEKGCELGISHFIPIEASRNVVRLTPDEFGKKKPRWERILEASAKQCNTPRIPKLFEPQSFKEALSFCAKFEDTLKIFCWEAQAAPPLWRVFKELKEKPKAAAIFIGPEGGWSPQETQAAQQAGFHLVGLGPFVLRAETAALVAVSMLQALYGAYLENSR